MYGITADELHARVIADLRGYCEHLGLPTDRIGDGHQRPLEQTVRLVCELRAADAANGLAAEIERLRKELRRLRYLSDRSDD